MSFTKRFDFSYLTRLFLIDKRSPKYVEHTLPGKVAGLPKPVFAVAMFSLVVRRSMNPGASSEFKRGDALPE